MRLFSLTIKKFFLVIILIFFTLIMSFGQENNTQSKGKQKNTIKKEIKDEIKKEVKAYISHHLLDAHSFNIYSYTDKSGHKKHIGLSLPVILWDGELKIFSSSKLHHGKTVAHIGENFYKLYHGNIYKTDEKGTINYDAKHNVINAQPLDFSITKNVFSLLIIACLMLLLFINLARSYQKNGNIAKGIGRFFEPIILYIRDEIARPNIGAHKYKKYMSFLLTVFFFIWFFNLAGLMPFGINVTGNISITLSLAVITFLITNLTANKNYWKHIFWMPNVSLPVKIFLAPIEFLGILIKPFSLMIRLYANISAGHIILMSIIGLIFIFKTWISTSLSLVLAFGLTILEILVALLQAYIFTMLSALYFGFANEEHEEAH